MFNRDVFKTIAKSKMKLFVTLVCDLQSSANVGKNSILGFAVVLDPGLEVGIMYFIIFAGVQIN